MIRINLANDRRVSKKGGGAKRSGGGSAGRLFLLLFLMAALGGGGYYYMEYMAKPAPDPVKPALPPPVPRDGATAAAKPSSMVRTNMAENVVKEVADDTRAENKLDLPYAEMGMPEKINYEVAFGRNVFNMIARCSPPGVRFRSLNIDDFQTIHASGAGASRGMVEEMFASFKMERGELMPKPLSYIKDDNPVTPNYRFEIVHMPRFGLGVGDPFQAIEHIGFRESVQTHLKTFSRLAGENGYKVSAAPSQVSVERAGNYRRMIYRATGMTTFADFHRFVLALYDEKVPCAIKKVSMVPVRDEQVRVTAEILFTVKE